MSFSVIKELENEIVNFARSLVKDPSGRETTTIQSFNGDGNNKTFTLTQTGTCINTVTVTSVSKVWGTDYVYDGDTKIITFTTAPAGGTNNVVISHDYGYYWGYWGYPAVSTMKGNYPIFGITWLGGESVEGDIRVDYLVSSPIFRIWCYAEDTDVIKKALQDFRDAFKNKSDWYLSGVGYGRIIPISTIIEPSPDSRRIKSRYMGSHLDFQIVFLDES